MGADRQFPEETSLPGPSRSKKGALAADLDSDGARAFDSVEEGGAELEETRAISDPVSLVSLSLHRE